MAELLRDAATRELLVAFRRAVDAKISRDITEEDHRADALRAETVAALRRALAAARAEGLCGAAWLFGSFAWGKPGERSDVDVLAEDCTEPLRVADFVSSATRRDAHVVAAARAPESLRRRAQAEGIPV